MSTEHLTKDEGVAPCDECGRVVGVKRDLDGHNNRTGPWRFDIHAGRKWGRPCKGGGELVDEMEHIE